MRLDEYQIANALIDTRLVMTSRLVGIDPPIFPRSPFVGTNPAGELITSGLPVSRTEQPGQLPRSGLAARREDHAEWIDKRDGAGYGWASALTGRLLPAAREASHLFSF